ncbi:MAG: outer membrane beta-barrel protein [Saprospiraceae bacterium]|nr:outer membrane beta-barrel protein [Saprospiraceae bacterium]
MNKKDFDPIDKIARDALNNFQVEFDPANWDKMENKLDSEYSVDKTAKDSLQNHEVTFDNPNWLRLEKQLNKNKHLYPHLWWVKSAEVSIMALLIFTIFNFSNTNSYYTNQNHDNAISLNYSFTKSKNSKKQKYNTLAYDAQIQSKDKQNKINVIVKEENTNLDTEYNKKFTKTQQKNNESTNIDNNKIQSLNRRNIATNVTDIKNKSSVSSQENKENEHLNNNSFDLSNDNPSINTTFGNSKESQNTSISVKNENKNSDRHQHLNNNISKKLKLDINNLSFQFLETIDSKPGIPTTEPVFELKKLKLQLPYHCKFYVGGVASIGANLSTSMGGSSVGYGAGVTLDAECSSRFMIKSGVLLSYKRYEIIESSMLDKTSIDGNIYNIEKTIGSNLVTLEIPIDVQFTFFRNEKWKIYTNLGVSANIIASRTYNGTEKTSFAGLSVSTDINTNDYESGFFEGGTFDDNTFLSIGGGIGLERQLGDKISLYLLPTYRHAITPAGRDYINTFNFNIGIKSAL